MDSPLKTNILWPAVVIILTLSQASHVSWSSSAGDKSTTHTDELSAILSEPNQIHFESFVVATVLKIIEDPNKFTSFLTTVEMDTVQPPLQDSDKPHKYWQRNYHRQVNDQLFAYLKYPYGKSSHSDSHGKAGKSNSDANAFEPMRDGIVTRTDLIHRWRNMNESEGTMLEVVRAIELTKAATQIYRIKPELAVAAKRTLGRIGQLNRKFDLISRMAIELSLRGFTENELKNRTEKQLSNLESLLDLLARQNDALSEALGLGRINRMPKQPDYLDKIDYSAHLLPRKITLHP